MTSLEKKAILQAKEELSQAFSALAKLSIELNVPIYSEETTGGVVCARLSAAKM